MLKSIFSILLLHFAICSCEADQFSENVANFALESINQISNLNSSLLVEENAYIPSDPSGIFNIQGVLKDTHLAGLNSITKASTLVGSLTLSGLVNLEYRFIIETPVLTGRYNLSGFIGSPSLPFGGVGDFRITFVNPINISCSIGFSSINGFLQLGSYCFSTSSSINVTNAKLDFEGIEDHALLDPPLKVHVLEYVVDYVNTYTLSRAISDSIVRFVNSQLKEDFQSRKLMDIILSNNTIMSNLSHKSQRTFSQDDSVSSIVENRLSAFVEGSTKSLLYSIEEPFDLGTSFFADNFRNALFPSSGTVSELRLTGFSNLSALRCSSRVSQSRTEFTIMIEMLNVTLLGKYDITGSIVGETPVNASGEFSIQSEMGARYDLGLSFRNVNGHLALDWTFIQGFSFLSDTFGTSFPGLLDDVDLMPEIAKMIVDSVGRAVVCPRQSFCSHEFITRPMRLMFEEHLGKTFSEIPIVEIITIS